MSNHNHEQLFSAVKKLPPVNQDLPDSSLAAFTVKLDRTLMAFQSKYQLEEILPPAKKKFQPCRFCSQIDKLQQYIAGILFHQRHIPYFAESLTNRNLRGLHLDLLAERHAPLAFSLVFRAQSESLVQAMLCQQTLQNSVQYTYYKFNPHFSLVW